MSGDYNPKIAQFWPVDYVNKLWNLQVPRYTGYPGGLVSLTTYLCANPSFGGAAKGQDLLALIRVHAKGQPEAGTVGTEAFARVFTGQGMPADIVAAMAIVNDHQALFRTEKSLAPYFKHPDFLQAMVDDGCFGQDCIGFVGTYMTASALQPSYVGRRPLDYANVFRPIKSFYDLDFISVAMLTNGMHIQMINSFEYIDDTRIKVDLCQSTHPGGPQLNRGVTVKAGGGKHLPIEEFRKALSSGSKKAEHEADNRARSQTGKKEQDYETYLRASMTTFSQFGYMGGAIFMLGADGDPPNPVSGAVYLGVAPELIRVRTP